MVGDPKSTRYEDNSLYISGLPHKWVIFYEVELGLKFTS